MRLTESEYAALLARGNLPPQPAAVARAVMRLRELQAMLTTAPLAEERFAVTLVLPWAPSINRSLVYGHKGRLEARRAIWAYRAAVCLAVEAQWPVTLFRPLNGRLALHIVFSPSTRRTFDLDNPIKQIFDSLATDGTPSLHPRASVYLDDKQIDHFTVTRGPVCPDASRVTVHISPWIMSR